MAAAGAFAFDVYGTLVDPIGISRRLEHQLGGDTAARVAQTWRRKQLELTFRLSVMGRYRDFEWCTRKALDHALAEAGADLDTAARDALISQYDDLDTYADTAPGLDRLRSQGHTLAVLSNGSPRMLRALLANTGLAGYLPTVLSVDEVSTYKPSPVVYHHAARRLELPPAQVRLVSANPFDIIGAESAGLRAAWVDRGNGLYEPDAQPPEVVVRTLTELADALA